MIKNGKEAVIFYMDNRQKILSLVQTDLETTMHYLLSKEGLKEFVRPEFLFTCEPIDEKGQGITIGLTFLACGYDDKTTKGYVDYGETRIAVSLTNMYEYLSIVPNRTEVPEQALVDLIRFCCIHESIHYIQAWVGDLDKTMNEEPEELFIVNGIDIRKEPKKYDVYGRFIEISCINQCNDLFEKKVYGEISDAYMIFSMVGLISIELDGDEYERRLNQLGEMIRNRYY